jgi:hypothetical protein
MRSGGEGGTTPPLAAVINAIVDALAERDVRHMEMSGYGVPFGPCAPLPRPHREAAVAEPRFARTEKLISANLPRCSDE